MQDINEIAVPDAGRILLRRSDVGISIKHVENCVGGVRQEGDAHPGQDLSGRRIIQLKLMVELRRTGGIGAENYVGATVISDSTAIRNAFERGVRGVTFQTGKSRARYFSKTNQAKAALPRRYSVAIDPTCRLMKCDRTRGSLTAMPSTIGCTRIRFLSQMVLACPCSGGETGLN